jgi:ATP-dependent RNA helicase DDX10/DBP4
LLFSATIGKSLKEMVRVNLKENFEYICIHDFDSIESLANDYTDANGQVSKEDKLINDQLKSITPVKLLHYYMVVNLEDKLDVLFSFIRSHQSSKCLIFFSSCKQVRYAYETFKRLKLGIGLLELHGRQK